MVPLLTLMLAIGLLAVWAGGMYPLALCLASGLLCAGCVLHIVVAGIDTGKRWELLVFVAGIAALGWIGLTSMALPDWVHVPEDSLRGQLQASVKEVYREAHASGWDDLPDAPPRYLTLNRAGTMRILVLGLGMFCAMWLTARMPSAQRAIFLQFMVCVGVVVAVGGMLARYSLPTHGKIWWIFKTPAKQSMGCFVNPNHFGAFLAMICPAVVALGVEDIRRREWERLVLWSIALGIVIAGVIASQSRGAYVSMFISVSATGLLLPGRRDAQTGIALGGLVCMGLVLMSFLETPTMDREIRSLREPQAYGRIRLWKEQTLPIWRKFTYLGVGAEGYRTISTRNDPWGAERSFCHHAESTYLQILADSGLLGVTLMLGLAVGVAAAAWSNLRQARLSGTARVAGLAGMFVAALHGTYDFGLHVPVYGILVAIFVGMLLRDRPDRATPTARGAELGRLSAVVPLTGLTVIALIWTQFGDRIYYRDKERYVKVAPAKELLDNVTWAPAYWANWYYLGRAALTERNWPEVRFGEKCLARAAAMDPKNPKMWSTLANVRKQLRDQNGAEKALKKYLGLLPEKQRRKARRDFYRLR